MLFRSGSLPPASHIYLAIFGWVSPTTLSHCRADVRDGYSRYMNLIHKIARNLLLANTEPTSSTANRQNVSTPNRPRRGSHAEEATTLRHTSAEVSASEISYNAALGSVLELKRLKLVLVLTTSSEIESIKQNQISTTTVESNKRFKALDNMLHVVGLYPMAMGTRREPALTRQNPSQQSPAAVLALHDPRRVR